MTPKGKKEYIRLSLSSLNSFDYFFAFWFKGLSFKTQFKIEFRPPVNGDQLVLEWIPAVGVCMFHVNNGNTRAMSEKTDQS